MAQPTTMPAAPDGPNMGANVSPEELAAMDAASVGDWNGGPIDAMKPEAFSTFGVGQGPDTQYNMGADVATTPDAVFRSTLLSGGLPEHVVDGIMMNAHDESGFNPTAVGDNGNAFGMLQWNGPRKRALQEWSAANGLNPADPATQAKFTIYELQGPEASAGRALLSTSTPGEAGAVFVNQYERPAEEHRARREAAYLGGGGTLVGGDGMYSGGGMSSGGSPIPMSGGGANSLAAITAALSDPWVAKKYGPVLNALMGQEMKRGDMQYEAQLRQSDPMYQAQLKAAEAALQPAPMKPIEVGGVLLDPVTYQPIFDSRSAEESARPMTPEERAAYGIPETDVTPYKMTSNGPVAIGGGGVNVTVGGGPEMGKLSTDYGYVADPTTGQPVIDPATGLPKAAPVPGSPAWLEAQAAAAAGERALGNADTVSDGILAAATRARDAAKDRTVSGLFGQAAALNPGSKNAEVYRQVDVLKSNAKISNLQAMRDASKTGGALGAVTAPELKMLEDKSGALDPASPYFERDLADYTLTLLKTVHGPEAGQLIFDQQYAGMAPPAGGGLPPGFVED